MGTTVYKRWGELKEEKEDCEANERSHVVQEKGVEQRGKIKAGEGGGRKRERWILEEMCFCNTCRYNKWSRDNPAHLDANICIVHAQYLINETVNTVGSVNASLLTTMAPPGKTSSS